MKIENIDLYSVMLEKYLSDDLFVKKEEVSFKYQISSVPFVEELVEPTFKLAENKIYIKEYYDITSKISPGRRFVETSVIKHTACLVEVYCIWGEMTFFRGVWKPDYTTARVKKQYQTTYLHFTEGAWTSIKQKSFETIFKEDWLAAQVSHFHQIEDDFYKLYYNHQWIRDWKNEYEDDYAHFKKTNSIIPSPLTFNAFIKEVEKFIQYFDLILLELKYLAAQGKYSKDEYLLLREDLLTLKELIDSSDQGLSNIKSKSLTSNTGNVPDDSFVKIRTFLYGFFKPNYLHIQGKVIPSLGLLHLQKAGGTVESFEYNQDIRKEKEEMILTFVQDYFKRNNQQKFLYYFNITKFRQPLEERWIKKNWIRVKKEKTDS